MYFMNTRACIAHLPYWETSKYIRQPRINSISANHDSVLTRLTQRAGRRVLPLRSLHSGLENTRRSSKCPQNSLTKSQSPRLEREKRCCCSPAEFVSVSILHLPLLYHPVPIAHLDCSWGVAMLCGPPRSYMPVSCLDASRLIYYYTSGIYQYQLEVEKGSRKDMNNPTK